MAARSTLAENVADVLRHAIFQGAYPCGERLVELAIAHELNISQNTVRDALRLLEQDGLVVKHARLGTYIRAYTANEVSEIYALWTAVESLALGWLIPHITPDQIAMLWQLLQQFQEQGGTERRFRLHETLAEFAGRRHTIELLRPLHNQARLLQTLRPPHVPRQHAAQIAVYTALLEAVAAGDTPRAQQVLRDHLAAESAVLAARVAEI